ncbi:MAG: hypothetical protein N3B15_01235 [Planctomycetota bacterium]|nr:hypothetical protein [Planctomycetota bacterium]
MMPDDGRDAGVPTPWPPLRFAARYPDGSSPLLKHLLKHVIEQRDERWQQLLPMGEIDLVRDPSTPEPLFQEALHLLAFRYEHLAGVLVVRRWLEQRDIAGWLTVLDEETLRWGLGAWDEERRLWVVAACERCRDQQGAYRLLTCFRSAVRTKQDYSATRFRHWVCGTLLQQAAWPARLVFCGKGPVRELLEAADV